MKYGIKKTAAGILALCMVASVAMEKPILNAVSSISITAHADGSGTEESPFQDTVSITDLKSGDFILSGTSISDMTTDAGFYPVEDIDGFLGNSSSVPARPAEPASLWKIERIDETVNDDFEPYYQIYLEHISAIYPAWNAEEGSTYHLAESPDGIIMLIEGETVTWNQDSFSKFTADQLEQVQKIIIREGSGSSVTETQVYGILDSESAIFWYAANKSRTDIVINTFKHIDGGRSLITSHSAALTSQLGLTDESRISLTTGSEIAYVHDSTFLDAKYLQSISMPNVVTVRMHAFHGCTSLEEVNLPNVTLIDSEAFTFCSKLKTLSLPNAENIKYQAFVSCTALESLSLPNVQTIGEEAFAICSQLSSLTMPKITQIGAEAFYNTSKSFSILLSGDQPAGLDAMKTDAAMTVYYPTKNETWAGIADTDLVKYLPYDVVSLSKADCTNGILDAKKIEGKVLKETEQIILTDEVRGIPAGLWSAEIPVSVSSANRLTITGTSAEETITDKGYSYQFTVGDSDITLLHEHAYQFDAVVADSPADKLTARCTTETGAEPITLAALKLAGKDSAAEVVTYAPNTPAAVELTDTSAGVDGITMTVSKTVSYRTAAGEAVSGTPQNAGSYIASAEVTVNGNAYVLEKPFTIAPRALENNNDIVLHGLDENFVYGSDLTVPNLTISDKGTLLTADDVEINVASGSSAGEYDWSITATKNGNYFGKLSGTWELKKAEMPAFTLKADKSKRYDGKPLDITVEGNFPKDAVLSYHYDLVTDSNKQSLGENAPTDAGSYLLTVSASAPNYESASQELAFTIEQIPICLDLTNECNTVTYGEEPEIAYSLTGSTDCITESDRPLFENNQKLLLVNGYDEHRGSVRIDGEIAKYPITLNTDYLANTDADADGLCDFRNYSIQLAADDADAYVQVTPIDFSSDKIEISGLREKSYEGTPVSMSGVIEVWYKTKWGYVCFEEGKDYVLMGNVSKTDVGKYQLQLYANKSDGNLKGKTAVEWEIIPKQYYKERFEYQYGDEVPYELPSEIAEKLHDITYSFEKVTFDDNDQEVITELGSEVPSEPGLYLTNIHALTEENTPADYLFAFVIQPRFCHFITQDLTLPYGEAFSKEHQREAVQFFFEENEITIPEDEYAEIMEQLSLRINSETDTLPCNTEGYAYTWNGMKDPEAEPTEQQFIETKHYRVFLNVCQNNGKLYVAPKKLTADMASLEQDTFCFHGKDEIAGIQLNTELTEGKDYFLTGDTAACEPGEYTVILVGQGNYSGKLKLNWTIADYADRTYKHSISLTNDLAINFYVSANGITDLDDLALEVLNQRTGKTEMLKGTPETLSGEQMYKFSYKGIAAKNAGDKVTATLVGTLKNGTVFRFNSDEYSIADYCYTAAQSASSEKIKTLAVDLLNFCAAVQKYADNSIADTDLVNAKLTDEQKKLATQNQPNLVSVENTAAFADATAAFSSKSLLIGNKISLKYYVDLSKVSDVKNVTITLKYANKTKTFAFADFEKGRTAGEYTITYSDLPVSAFDEPIEAVIYENGKTISGTFTYSVASYAYKVQNSASSSEYIKAVTDTMMRYAASAKAYAAK